MERLAEPLPAEMMSADAGEDPGQAGAMDPMSDGSNPGQPMDQEKKIRREIANSNERRRMQSINAGFQSLRTLLPQHEGEKLSKAAILQQTAEYIYSLEQEKTRLLAQNCHLKRLLSLSQQHLENLQDPPAAGAATASAPAGANITQVATAAATTPAATRRKRSKLDIETETKVIEHKMVPSAPPAAVMAAANAASTVAVSQPPPIVLESLAPEPVTIVSAPAAAITARLADVPELPSQPQPAHHHQAPPQQQQQQQTIVIHTSAPAPVQVTAPVLPTTPAAVVPQALPSSVTAKIIEAARKQQEQQQQQQVSLPRAPQPPQPATSVPAVIVAAAAAESGVTTTTVKLSNATPKPESSSFVVTSGGGSNSKQNLDSIVEAIRHLEGDHLFNNSSSNNVPVDATTTKRVNVPVLGREVTVVPSASATPLAHAQVIKQGGAQPSLQGQLTLQMEDGKQIVMLKQ